MSALLEVRGLHVEIPLAGGLLKAVRDVTFTVDRGQTLALVGESGCGKSLTALAVMDLLPPRAQRRAERLRFEGLDLRKARTRRMADLRGNKIAMIFQEPMTSLNPCYTIGN
ncbi:MAG: ABC transporter ATP-binding protein, partial [Syntrophobacteraceae bacterium]|nr:ABC transporter ATP-binding protein [Syntrophobacteraceae bacterium]